MTVTEAGTNDSVAVAALLVDGKKSGYTDEHSRLILADQQPGAHILVVEAPGYANSKSSSITVEAGQLSAITINLQPLQQYLTEVVVTSGWVDRPACLNHARKQPSPLDIPSSRCQGKNEGNWLPILPSLGVIWRF